jgi:hypothetical protein
MIAAHRIARLFGLSLDLMLSFVLGICPHAFFTIRLLLLFEASDFGARRRSPIEIGDSRGKPLPEKSSKPKFSNDGIPSRG